MDTFKEISPQEAQLIALQFMGQAVSGELKELDKNIINRTNQLQGTNLNVKGILHSIGSVQPSQPPPAPHTPQVQQNISTVQTRLPQIETAVHEPALKASLDKISQQLDKIIKLLDK